MWNLFLLTLVSSQPTGILKFGYEIVATYPHSKSDFTQPSHSQGLIFEDSKTVIQSTGLYNQSKLQRIKLENGKVIKEVNLDDSLFGEGVEQLNGKLYQLTWREQVLLVYKQSNLSLDIEVPLDEEIKQGWGICTDGEKLYITEGSEKIFVMNPETFVIEKVLRVRFNNKTVTRLNELEWIDGKIWANIWYSHYVVQIDPETAEVVGVIDFTGLEAPDEYNSWGAGDVLNGIAYYEEGNRILVTGKKWGHMYEVVLTGPEVVSNFSLPQ